VAGYERLNVVYDHSSESYERLPTVIEHSALAIEWSRVFYEHLIESKSETLYWSSPQAHGKAYT